MNAAARACARCGRPNPAKLEVCAHCLLAEDAELSRVGHLEIQELLGRGGMGEVFRARDVRLGRPVAVKFLPAELASTEEGRARFEREARALGLLMHPNIVTLYEFGEADGQPYLVMELVDGEPLPKRLPLPPAEALRVVIAVCEALEYAHAQGIVHRDVKPANVLVDRHGRVKLSDFGIARMRAGAHGEGAGWTLTQANAVVGTPQYLPPEALQGAPPDPRMDVFSVGVLLYELLTGTIPVGSFAPLPGELDRVVRKALSPKPEERQQTARELRLELEELARGAASSLGGHRGGELPEDEQVWIRAVALVHTIAAALVFFAGLAMFTPRVTTADDLGPLIALTHEKLADGRVVSRARFEMWPTVAAAVGLVAAILAYGFLRRHWRRNGLDERRPDEPVAHAWWVLAAGVGACALYALRRVLEGTGVISPTLYIPALGGLFEGWVVYLVFTVLLEARRRSRPLLRERWLWLGVVLALAPPVVEFVTYLQRWRP